MYYIILWFFILIILGCICIRWVPKDHYLFIQRGRNQLILESGIVFLIPIYDKIKLLIPFKEEKVKFCLFETNDGSYTLEGSYSFIDIEKIDSESTQKLSTVTTVLAENIQLLIKEQKIDLDKDSVKLCKMLEEKVNIQIANLNLKVYDLKVIEDY